MPDSPDPPEPDFPPSSYGNGSGREAYAKFFERIVRYLNDAMADDELRAFNAELEMDSAKQDLFVRACLTQAAVSEELSTQYQIFRESLASRQERLQETKIPTSSDEAPSEIRPGPRWYRWAAAAAIVALVGIPVGITISSRFATVSPKVMPSFALVTASYHAHWESGPDSKGELPPQEQLTLSSGWAEMTYTTGTKVTLIAPARFTMDSPTHLSLRAGRLSATVAGRNFVLLTPDARIADLGTEFGVSVLDRTEFAVFTGKVEANSLQDHDGSNRRVLSAGDVAGITADHVVDGAQQAWPQLFPRRLPAGMKRLSVSDLLSGGDGTTMRTGAALDVSTGVWTYDGKSLTPKSSTGDHAFHAAPQLHALNGCFVPDGPSTIDAAGHVYNFSRTANVSYNQLRVGGIVPWLREDPHRMSTVLNGTDYASDPHSLVEFQSNKGITFDLEGLRAMHPDVVFSEFRALLGNSFPKHLGGETSVARSSIYVLVDGQMRFQLPQFSNQDAPTSINVPIQRSDRFLTIAVTDGGDGTNGDWVLLGDPELTLAAGEAKP